MSLPASQFKFINRQFPQTLILLPGWATDYRIFAELNLPYNYLVPLPANPYAIEALLPEMLASCTQPVSILGWSLGGFVAINYIRQYQPNVQELILIGIRAQFTAAGLDVIRQKLRQNKAAYLYSFYRSCFGKKENNEFRIWYKKLLQAYTREMNQIDLEKGLDYLQANQIRPEDLKLVARTRVLHGQEDQVAPHAEAEALITPGVSWESLPNKGHACLI